MNMVRETNKLDLRLHRRAFYHVAKVHPGMTVFCEEGLVWVTEANNPQDYMLRPGKSMLIRKRGDVLIEALSDAEISIVNPN
jgi:hypothetical protein